METRNYFLGIFMWVATYFSVDAQNVGINTEQPQATLHVVGNLRVDSVPIDIGNQSISLAINSNNQIVKQPVDTLGEYITVIYGENINAGDAVSIGDGLTGYKTIDQTSNNAILTLPVGNWIGQTFMTTNNALALRMVGISTSGGISTLRVRIRDVSGGIPTGSDLGIASYYQNPTSHGVFYFVFSQPVPVLPNHMYALIFDASVQVKPDYSTLNPYLYGNRLHSTDGGITWTSFTAQDLEFHIYEVQSIAGLAYKAVSVSGITPLVSSGLGLGAGSSGPSDRTMNFIGFARDSGAKGFVGRISVGSCITVPQVQVGTSYWLSASPGTITSQSGDPEKYVGFGVKTNKLFVVH